MFTYCKIPKKSPKADIIQRPYSRGIFLEGDIFGGAYLSRSTGLALKLKVNLQFLLCFTLYLNATFQVQASGWGLYLEGWSNGGFFTFPLWGAYILRGLYMEGLIFGILQYISLTSKLCTHIHVTYLWTYEYKLRCNFNLGSLLLVLQNCMF